MSKRKCRYCDDPVNLHDEGVTYEDGSCAHEECDDAEQFRKENEIEMMERNEA